MMVEYFRFGFEFKVLWIIKNYYLKDTGQKLCRCSHEPFFQSYLSNDNNNHFYRLDNRFSIPSKRHFYRTLQPFLNRVLFSFDASYLL